MNRRDFLLFRTEARTRVAELSCEQLYMRFMDLQLRGGDAADASAEGESERAPVFGDRSTEQLLDTLRRDLEGVDVLSLLEASWLAHRDFREALEPLLTAFRARGGIVKGA